MANGQARPLTQADVDRARAILRAAGIAVADEGMAEDFFIYNTPRVVVPVAPGTNSASIVFQADSAFDIIKSMFFADIALAAQTVNTQVLPNILVLIVDSGAGRQLMNTAVPIYTLFGMAANPFIWPVPKRVAPNSTWTFTFTNLEATAYGVSLTLAGKKIFYKA